MDAPSITFCGWPALDARSNPIGKLHAIAWSWGKPNPTKGRVRTRCGETIPAKCFVRIPFKSTHPDACLLCAKED